MTKQQYNDRIAGEANIHELGYAAYKLKRDTYFVAMPDEFFINRGAIGVANTITLLMFSYGNRFDELFTNREYGDPILSSSGLSLGANMRYTASSDIKREINSNTVIATALSNELMAVAVRILINNPQAVEDYSRETYYPTLLQVAQTVQGIRDRQRDAIVDWFVREIGPYIITIASMPNPSLNHMGTLGLIYRAMQEYHHSVSWEPASADQIKHEFKLFLNYVYEYDAVPNLAINAILQNIYGRPNIPGIRMSTFESDRPVHTQIREQLAGRTYKLPDEGNREIKVDGVLGGLLYNPRWSSKMIESGGMLVPDTTVTHPSAGYFNSELIAFYAPDILERDNQNIHDDRYKLNALGILTEMRKYKTTNILNLDSNNKFINFHQGHLYEHSTWTALNSRRLDTELREQARSILQQENINSDVLNIDDIVILATGLLHDIGKGGFCLYTTPPKAGEPADPNKKQIGIAYLDYNPHTIPKPYWCNVIKDDINELGFTYYDQPIHPEEGYRVLKGLIPFTMYSFTPDNVIQDDYNLVSRDWDHYQKAAGFTAWYQMKYVRIGTAAHWNFGPIASQYNTNPSDAIVLRYLRKIERYYNAEFGKFDMQVFIQALYVTMIVSVADIYASLYNKQLLPDNPEKIYNNFPNYHIYTRMLNYVANKITDMVARNQWQEFVAKNPNLFNVQVNVMTAPGTITVMQINNLVQVILTETDATNKAVWLDRALSASQQQDFNPVYSLIWAVLNRDGKVLDQIMVQTAEAYSGHRDALGNPPLPKIYAENAKKAFKGFFKAAVRMLKSGFNSNPYNTYMVLENLLYSYTNVPALYKGHRRFAPKALIFDLDKTLLFQGPNVTQKEYTFFTDIPKILATCKYLRQRFGVKLAIATRHYIPKQLLEEIAKPDSLLYYKNFDVIVSQYTGNVQTLHDYCKHTWTKWGGDEQQCLNYLEPCNIKDSIKETFIPVYNRQDQPIDDGFGSNCPKNTFGFVLYKSRNDKYIYTIGQYSTTEQQENIGKGPHMDIIKHILGLAPEQMMLFDDSIKYISGEQLGGNKVYTAGVDGKYGLTMGLFKTAISMYIYEQFVT
uniref:Uncharacterized protein n=1 Tax=Marseillevirus LCMAC202 TaxID=2506606 RepID=A0A481YYB7_9VIRU|nr:MAG: hypothetical protein LCMAC202_06040 [Marseillevirus LCMAC202]